MENCDRWTPLGAQESHTEVHSSSDGKNALHLAAADDVTTAAKAGWLQLTHCPPVIVSFICQLDILKKKEPQLRICLHQTDLDLCLQDVF